MKNCILHVSEMREIYKLRNIEQTFPLWISKFLQSKANYHYIALTNFEKSYINNLRKKINPKSKML